jgi:hypothetical protein
MLEMRKQPYDDGRWHLDRRVPLSLIGAMLLQTAGFGWWASSVTERVNTLERQAVQTAPQDARLTRVEVKLEVVQEGIGEIKRLIQQRK